MRKINWILGLVLLAVIGYLLYNAVKHRRSAPRAVSELPADVGSDSIDVYRQRVTDLKQRAEVLRARLAVAGKEDKPAVKERLAMVRDQIESLERAIHKWELVLNPDERAGAYRQCIMYYGKASGVCDALAPDTLGAK
jgi:hypothetical protein